MYSRREFTLAAVGTAVVGKPVNGVVIGVQTNSFSDRPLDAAIAATKELGFRECELWQGHVEPKVAKLKEWREQTPASYFQGIARQLKQAGIQLYSYDYQFHDTFEDNEIERGFFMAKALGAKCIVTSSATVALAKRIAPFADKHKMVVGMHGRTNIEDPNEFATPGSFETAMSFSPNIEVNLDLGHYTAAGFDAIAFIEKHYSRIVSIHLKDRKKNNGPSMSFGEGDSPIRECLRLLKKNRWKIPAHIEHDRGGDRVAEVRKSYRYCVKALSES